MIYLFSETGQAALRSFVDRSTLFAFDLDGTLAPIVADPARIEIPKETKEKLIDLNRMATVAIISGRSRTDARNHLGFTPRFLIGNHGAEGLPGREKQEEEFRGQCIKWQKQLERFLPLASESGILIENKGMTLSVHYRRTSNQEAAVMNILEVIGQLKPFPKRIPGKCVENLLPAEAPRKGEALLQIMRHTGCPKALFVGDDATDEDVFRLDHDSILGIRVGCEGSSLAAYCLKDQKEMSDLLGRMVSLKNLYPGGIPFEPYGPP
ncbi:trehalose 6-phosphatase [Syntrophus gentianae]|uniref:Trehalose 6-phosphate phosphatase n=1 Tax=Syntrophus gentianae TaxID=43775 RepID=A0A1H7UY56_9BACT|nr:trehalose-phosphatase [Syntrophus gentianae]SEM01558.1 trehalose 6-phosphatase [Syntrophus gentianae]